MIIVKYDQSEWADVSEQMHYSVFGEYRPKTMSRIDFALVAWDDEKPIGYVTCREFDSETIYMSYGGFLEKGFKNLSAYKMCLDTLRSDYCRATTIVENTNFSMIKLAMSQGFLINGLRRHKSSTLLELCLEWKC